MFFKKKKEITEPDEITGKRVLVIGAGRSGIGSVRLLNHVGAHPVLLEENDKRTADEIRQSLSYDDRDVTEIVVGRLDAETANTIDLVVPSPGVPAEAPVLNRFALNGVKIISEVELAYRYMKGKLVAITGTNGKTTTTTLVYEILKQNWQYGAEEVFLVGNIGESFAAHALETTEKSITVAEISSFQLEHIDRFRADVSAILNITPDHLDRHHTMENYARIKERITNRQTKDNKKEKFTNLCVLNADDPRTNDFGTNRCKAGVLWFSTHDEVPILAYVLKGDDIFFRIDKYSMPDEFVMHFSDCRLKGLCNAENVMAAIAITRCLGVEEAKSVPVVREFKPVAHRIEYIATKKGADWYNDSKATNPDSAIQGILAMDKPTILIGGGYDKGSDYDAWTKLFPDRVKELVLIGATKEAIAKSAEQNGFTNIHFEETFEGALTHCAEIAENGDAVLLSPACASWGMFKDYEERGERFRAFVLSLEG